MYKKIIEFFCGRIATGPTISYPDLPLNDHLELVKSTVYPYDPNRIATKPSFNDVFENIDKVLHPEYYTHFHTSIYSK